MQSKPFMVRQGDVLIVAAKQPKQTKEVERENGHLILAHGKATGHTHHIAAKEASLFAGENGRCFLRCDIEVDLMHQEHAAISIPAGDYEVIRQREYSPEAIRNVAD